MKKFMITSILLAIFFAGTNLSAQDQRKESLGLPGDNLNLYAVMKLFQESETLEGFERSLNDKNSNINNLDLNGDNLVDYLKVIDYVDGDVHNIVLQVAINSRESQDVAAFTVQRDNSGQVQIQLTGDEELYGRDYIIEPIFDEANNGQTPNPGYMGNTSTFDGRPVAVVRTTRLEIASWPVVRFIYLPGYVTWHSNWHYDYYPSYWHPWRPYYWDFYYGYHYNWYNDYYAHYRRWDHHRYDNWHNYYWVGKRSYSSHVNTRIKEGNYRSTYSHPDQRREGEALYTKMYKEQSRRQTAGTSGNSVARRSGTESSRDKQTATNVTRRQAPAPVTSKTSVKSSKEMNTGTSRRAPASGTNKAATRSSNEQKAAATRRTPAAVTTRPPTSSSADQNPGTSRRSTSAVKSTSSSNARSGQKAATAPSSGNSKSTTVSKSERRKSVTSKPKATKRQQEKVKNTDTSNDSRRK